MLRWLLGGRHGRSFADLPEESVGLIDKLIDEQQRLKHSVETLKKQHLQCEERAGNLETQLRLLSERVSRLE